jgi:hypothetical protein
MVMILLTISITGSGVSMPPGWTAVWGIFFMLFLLQMDEEGVIVTDQALPAAG